MAKTAQEKADLKAEKLYEKTHKKKYRTRPGDMLFNLINYLIFILFTVACIFPFYYLFINTISDNDLVVKGVINFIPRGLHLDNYKSLLNVSDLSNAFLVSVGRTLLGTAFMVAASAFVGYLVTKQEMWGRKFWYRFLIITMYFNAGLIPWFLNMQMLGLTNTFWAYIIPGIVAPYNIILVKTYIESIPAELEESAQIDGATHMVISVKSSAAEQAHSGNHSDFRRGRPLEFLYGFPDSDAVRPYAVYTAAQALHLPEYGFQLKRTDGIRRTGKRCGPEISAQCKGY